MHYLCTRPFSTVPAGCIRDGCIRDGCLHTHDLVANMRRQLTSPSSNFAHRRFRLPSNDLGMTAGNFPVRPRRPHLLSEPSEKKHGIAGIFPTPVQLQHCIPTPPSHSPLKSFVSPFWNVFTAAHRTLPCPNKSPSPS
jgi:hypothetical protein